jgi:Rdx family protein
VSLANEVLGRWAPIIRVLELRSGVHGVFDVTLDGERVFSKGELKRHPKTGEVAAIFERKLGAALKWREES